MFDRFVFQLAGQKKAEEEAELVHAYNAKKLRQKGEKTL